ncbi:unnamed protein product [Bursaphelenchus okinawaensis]|uniref:Endonuclease/exonuclease/phosphatase domain-containing protein n=1 Tax=Bursaphelenchus okinawaensis TaxID=465554 RepID=A0A811KR81_9BILA|nr:unnamed protein product [Bursaphelenchus okinawaensis]CAG9109826.1 unnamed protein product [Bursaphelenchus okinawaensis]
MNYRNLLLLTLLTVVAAKTVKNGNTYKVKKEKSEPRLWLGQYLRIMTFNTWNMGVYINDGLEKIAKHIALNDPDVVGLQEVRSREQIESVTKFLNRDRRYKWSYIFDDGHDCGVITKYSFNETSLTTLYAGIGVQVNIDNKRKVFIWSLHMDYIDYGPYAMMYRQTKDISTVEYGECHAWWNRCNNAKELINSEPFKSALARSDTEPVFVVGDFNAPSHLDYTEEAKHIHNGWVYAWPGTSILQNTTGLIDSFRELYPDPVKYPGTSWSTVNQFIGGWNYTIPEPQDRIDYIMYKSGGLKTVRSERYAGDYKPYPNSVDDNDWPSDHFAYISDFKGF